MEKYCKLIISVYCIAQNILNLVLSQEKITYNSANLSGARALHKTAAKSWGLTARPGGSY